MAVPEHPRVQSVAEALAVTHDWFAWNSGWAPPDPDELTEWLADDFCRAPDDCAVAPDHWCEHGLASWHLVLISMDPPEDPSSPV